MWLLSIFLEPLKPPRKREGGREREAVPVEKEDIMMIERVLEQVYLLLHEDWLGGHFITN